MQSEIQKFIPPLPPQREPPLMLNHTMYTPICQSQFRGQI